MKLNKSNSNKARNWQLILKVTDYKSSEIYITFIPTKKKKIQIIRAILRIRANKMKMGMKNSKYWNSWAWKVAKWVMKESGLINLRYFKIVSYRWRQIRLRSVSPLKNLGGNYRRSPGDNYHRIIKNRIKLKNVAWTNTDSWSYSNVTTCRLKLK